jgi:glycosyltransferase involved in cell wall biosynthesis
MKIAIVVSHPIQHFCPMYASWAKNKSIQLKVFFASNLGATSYIDKDFNTEIKWSNLYLNEFDHIFSNGDTLLPINRNLDIPNLDNQLDDYKPTMVIQYGRIFKFNKRLRNWALKRNVKIAYISDSENRHYEFIFKKILKNFIYRNYFKKIDLFLSVGDANEEFYKLNGVSESKILRINFSIDIRLFNKNLERKNVIRKNFRTSHSIKDNDIVISVVGKLVKWKSQIHIIKAIKYLENYNFESTIHLLIIGSGTEEKNITDEVFNIKNNKVHLLGFIDPIDLPTIYASSDIYVHPSSFEPHSLAVSEAIYMGLPIIVSDTSGSYGPMDDVQPGKNGMVYKYGDIKDLALTIKHLIENRNLLTSFAMNSLSIAKRQQDICHFEIIKKIYEKNYF